VRERGSTTNTLQLDPQGELPILALPPVPVIIESMRKKSVTGSGSVASKAQRVLSLLARIEHPSDETAEVKERLGAIGQTQRRKFVLLCRFALASPWMAADALGRVCDRKMIGALVNLSERGRYAAARSASIKVLQDCVTRGNVRDHLHITRTIRRIAHHDRSRRVRASARIALRRLSRQRHDSHHAAAI
jgi:hypothetical protein